MQTEADRVRSKCVRQNANTARIRSAEREHCKRMYVYYSNTRMHVYVYHCKQNANPVHAANTRMHVHCKQNMNTAITTQAECEHCACCR
jgi:hypothetical protein